MEKTSVAQEVAKIVAAFEIASCSSG